MIGGYMMSIYDKAVKFVTGMMQKMDRFKDIDEIDNALSNAHIISYIMTRIVWLSFAGTIITLMLVMEAAMHIETNARWVSLPSMSMDNACILFSFCALILLISALLREAASICIGSAERLKEIVTGRNE